ncbi:MAG: Bax inhibitor-1/YccA family protein [Verrucomicrobia bacterium]|nr:Bax inhibitor-1/YccA family protein [Verrucomicrobiota bacterium]
MRSTNPVLTESMFRALPASARAMTLRGVVSRTLLLLVLVAGSAAFSWRACLHEPGLAAPFAFGGALGGFILAMVTAFRPVWSRVSGPCYALAEGLFIGSVSVFFEQRFHGIVVQTVCLTFSVMFALLAGYQAGFIRVSQTFRSMIVAATAGVVLLYLGNMIFSLFSHQSFGFLQDAGPVGIGFSLLVAAVAAMNLVLDFEFIDQGVQVRAPQWMEWYSAFALTVTLVWLYLEILRLLSKIRRND